MRPLYVDTRYAGQHGIARYATEVIPRLGLAWHPFAPASPPTSMRGIMSPTYRALTSDSVLYSPGFNVGLTGALQVPTVHDLIHLSEPKRGKSVLHSLYYEKLVKPAIRRSGHVFTVSQTSVDAIRDWMGDAVTIHNTGNGCSNVFSQAGRSFQHDPGYLLYVGNLKSHKNPELAFRAVARLPDLHLIVVTSDVATAHQLADRCGIGGRVTAMDSVDDGQLADLYRGASALVFPSIKEGFGLPVLEALKCGTPVVYVRGCASVDEICAGTQFPVDDANDDREFAESCLLAMSTPFDSPSLLRFDWESVAAKIDSALAEIRAERK